jgi:hypothetical protein
MLPGVMKSLARIQQNSREINRMLAQINALVEVRDASPEQRRQWQAACEEFHSRYEGLCFPGGGAMLARVRGGDPAAIEAAVQFLLADPYHFRSGYLKERLWRWLANQPLSASARNRLERAALSYLDRRICREFRMMCKAMTRIGRAHFWSQVAKRAVAADSDPAAAKRATLLLAYGSNVHAGTVAHHRISQPC